MAVDDAPMGNSAAPWIICSRMDYLQPRWIITRRRGLGGLIAESLAPPPHHDLFNFRPLASCVIRRAAANRQAPSLRKPSARFTPHHTTNTTNTHTAQLDYVDDWFWIMWIIGMLVDGGGLLAHGGGGLLPWMMWIIGVLPPQKIRDNPQ